jgi:ubiquinone/menaquinone biosynthesis C-methylase UbiE
MHQKKRKIKDQYNKLGGKIYDIRYAEEQEGKYEIILKNIEINPSAIILDNGCGTGLLFKLIKQTTIGIDISNQLLKTAKVKITNQQNKHLIQADIDKLPLKNQCIDITFMVTVIQNLMNQLITMLEIQRVTKHHGSIIISSLKKTTKIKKLKKTIEKTNLKIKKIIKDAKIKDIIIFINN